MTDYVHPFTTVLNRAAKRVQPATIVDVGASNGQWSELALEIWPGARVLLIEANPVWKPASDAFCQKTGALSTWAVAGANEGHAGVEFFKEEPCQGIKLEPGGAVHPVTTIDAEVRKTSLPAPYLIKLDVHGHENMILEGARETLLKTSAVVVEVYLWEPRWGSLLFWEFIPIMLRYGFRPVDICSPTEYRPCDGRCAAIDMLFERSDAPGMDKYW